MFRKNHIVKINLPGGIIAAGDLYTIVEAAERAKVPDMQFGARQQLYCKVADRYGSVFFRELEQAGIFFETEKETHPNIISSYVTESVFGKSQWISEGLYKDILAGFDFRPRLKINLVESSQSLIPFFTGHLNFVSSAVNNHWHLYVRRPGTNDMYGWKTGVYSPDISRLSRLIEQHLLSSMAEPDAADHAGGASHPDAANHPGAAGHLVANTPHRDCGVNWGELLFAAVRSRGLIPDGPILPTLQLPSFNVPYYEGFNRYGNKSWLGIYRREELFPLPFLKTVSLICLQTKIGQLYTTPWKSLLIKDIEEPDLPLWEFALGKFRMNIRHASGELNWQMEDFCPEGLRLKRYLVRLLDQDDIRTEGLTFSIKTRRGSGLSGSVIIRKQEVIRPGQLKLLDRYEIWHTAGFNPHSKDYILFRKDLEKENIFPYLVSLCKEFYQLQNQQDPIVTPAANATVAEKVVYSCRHCLTQYDQQYGDPESGIRPGTSFEQVSPDYSCPLCGGPKADFRRLEKSTAIH
ncbi:MAG TPA: rubredoxin [Puia sp.]|jgi:rubredoxin|nr:rubredoxin [Puia sp.]